MQRKSVKVNRVIYAGCAVGVLAASAGILFGAAPSKKAFIRLDKIDYLKTGGGLIQNARGETVVLRGITLGSWLLQELRMCPNNGEDKARDYHATLAVLAERFGDKKAVELINIYLDNWITVDDLDRLKKLGVNCVRVPFTYRNFQSDDNGTRIRNKDGGIDFSRLDWIVSECGKRGIYVILDMHGAPGFQSSVPSCSRENENTLFDCSLAGLKYRQRTAELWQKLAGHFKGNPAVAAFDLLSGPADGFSGMDKNGCRLEHFYKKLLKVVRAEDPDRILIVHGGNAVENLTGAKCFHGCNIVYQPDTEHLSLPEIDRLISDISACPDRNIPLITDGFYADDIWDCALSAFNKNDIHWCVKAYKGVETRNSDLFVYTADMEPADLQEDTFEQIKSKWDKPCRTAVGFTRNKEFAAALKKYLTGADQTDRECPADGESAVTVEVYNTAGDVPKADSGKTDDPFKFVYGTVTLAGMGTLAELTKK